MANKETNFDQSLKQFHRDKKIPAEFKIALDAAEQELNTDPTLRDPANSKKKGYLGPLPQEEADRHIAVLHLMAGYKYGSGFMPQYHLNPVIQTIQSRTEEKTVASHQLYNEDRDVVIAKTYANYTNPKKTPQQSGTALPTPTIRFNANVVDQVINYGLKNAGKIIGSVAETISDSDIPDKQRPLTPDDILELQVALNARNGIDKETSLSALSTMKALKPYVHRSEHEKFEKVRESIVKNTKKEGPSQEHGKISKPSSQAPAATPDAAQPPASAKPDAAAPDCGVVDMGALMSGKLGDALKKPDPNCKPARNSGPVLGGD